jgi:peptidyl-prolyl cis-trans isomerase SurA
MTALPQRLRFTARPSAWTWAPAIAVAALFTTAPARATVVERVVAVIEDEAILLSDLKLRARPYLIRIYEQVPTGAQRAAAISQLYKAVLDRMVDEALYTRAANRAQLTVTAQEVDQALARVAQQNNVDAAEIIDEARRSGLSEVEYRYELKRQLLEAKLLNLRLQGRVRITEEDLRSLYASLERDERQKLGFRAARIVLDAPEQGASAGERRALAQSILARAQGGVDFAELARQHSTDAATRDQGGLLPPLKPGQLEPALDRLAMTLEVGQVSAVRVGDKLVVLKLVEREESELPSYEDAREELHQRVYMEKMEKARQHWLESMRRRTHVDIRL